MYKSRAKTRMILCAWAGRSESAHFAHVGGHFSLDAAHWLLWLPPTWFLNNIHKGYAILSHFKTCTETFYRTFIFNIATYNIKLNAEKVNAYPIHVTAAHIVYRYSRGDVYFRLLCRNTWEFWEEPDVHSDLAIFDTCTTSSITRDSLLQL